MRTRFPLRSTSVMESLLESDILSAVQFEVRKWKCLHRSELERDWTILRDIGDVVMRGREARYMWWAFSYGWAGGIMRIICN